MDVIGHKIIGTTVWMMLVYIVWAIVVDGPFFLYGYHFMRDPCPDEEEDEAGR